ncbi:MAG: isopenicillin N synthase family oxygenase [Chroococcidiopsidaceae cyanobacterium CP_BM_ER_R8_30]|nr:isopenicillin N synthase family oxygenase [Chroococcidiopsidaceae cyanobacterium CP_BM_ER_R8_30]
MIPVQIPIIDFALFRQGNAAERQCVAQQIYTACHEIGFMYLRNHGIPQSLLDRLLAQTRQFFNLPATVKEQVARSDQTNCGYIGFLKERLNPARPWDLKEAFNMGIQVVWPPNQAEFQEVVSEFYRLGTTVVAPEVLQAFAIALHLREDFFDDKHGQNYFLRMLHYPPVNLTPQPGQLRAGEHTDYGSITLLLQDGVGGLEVRTRQGKWIAAPPLPGTVVVNVGDAMQRWTNKQLCSTPHRVVVPTDAERSRYSVALFCDPNPEVEIACLESCHSTTSLPHYPPILAGDYLASRLAATY